MLIRAERDAGLKAPDLLAGVEQGVYIYSVLGMHTQDASSGKYSLVAPQARVIRAGRLLDGKVKIVLAGDFFAQLLDERTLFATYPYDWTPGMRVQAAVSASG